MAGTASLVLSAPVKFLPNISCFQKYSKELVELIPLQQNYKVIEVCRSSNCSQGKDSCNLCRSYAELESEGSQASTSLYVSFKCWVCLSLSSQNPWTKWISTLERALEEHFHIRSGYTDKSHSLTGHLY